MDSGWIVAGSSIATVVVTSLFNLLTKRVDSQQKLNEHKLAVRGSYVNKKIEAAQLLVNYISLILNECNKRYVYYNSHLSEKIEDEDMFNDVKEAEQKTNLITISGNNFGQLYFDIRHLENKSTAGWTKLNKHTSIYERLSNTNEFTPELEDEIRKILVILDELIDTHEAMITSIRNELAKYDVL